MQKQIWIKWIKENPSNFINCPEKLLKDPDIQNVIKQIKDPYMKDIIKNKNITESSMNWYSTSKVVYALKNKPLIKTASEVDIWVENILEDPNMFYNCPLHLKNNYKIKQAFEFVNKKINESDIRNKFILLLETRSFEKLNDFISDTTYEKKISREQLLNMTFNDVVNLTNIFLDQKDKLIGVLKRNTQLDISFLTFVLNLYEEKLTEATTNNAIKLCTSCIGYGAFYSYRDIKEIYGDRILSSVERAKPIVMDKIKSALNGELFISAEKIEFWQDSYRDGLYSNEIKELISPILGEKVKNAIRNNDYTYLEMVRHFEDSFDFRPGTLQSVIELINKKLMNYKAEELATDSSIGVVIECIFDVYKPYIDQIKEGTKVVAKNKCEELINENERMFARQIVIWYKDKILGDGELKSKYNKKYPALFAIKDINVYQTE